MQKEMLDPSSSTLMDAFPCGYVDGEGVLHKEFTVKELTGEEEDVLTGKGPVTARLNQVLLNCITRVGTLVERADIKKVIEFMSAVDRMVALIALRIVSVDKMMDIRIKPPGVAEIKTFPLDLSTLERRDMENPEKRSRSDVLSTGRKIDWHIMDGKDEQWLTDMKERLNGKDTMTLGMLARVDSIDGVELVRGHFDKKARKKGEQLTESFRALKGLRLRERNEIRGLFDEKEGFIDTSLEFEYRDDEGNLRTLTTELPVGDRSFFFPREM